MALARKSLDRPDGTREFPNRTDALVSLGGLSVARLELRPGWRWTKDVRPVVGTPTCEVAHTGYILSGRLRVETDEGTTVELVGGDVVTIPAGHDAWVVGDEPCLMLEWT
jgi:mannose-6-phosphate isomerase-like protein (cupin superfamily)